ncbi:MAG TPA: hypothetical protein VK717_00390 [Opitutaceae bacterium]|jgi:hypothetical protein|nr:hypothetical protein [Opitutaceae bacterium]
MPHFFRFFPLGALVLALAFFLNGCGGDHHRDIEAAPPVGPNGKPLPVLKAKDAFFDGKLFAEVTLSRGRGKGGYKPAPIPGMPSDDDTSDEEKHFSAETIDALQHRRAESPLPPVVLWLRLTSAASDPLKVEITDFKSDLGNFAVQPDHFTLAPGQSADPDPMISRLGMTSTEIPVTVSLRINGKKETRVLTLLPVADDASEPPAP